MERGLSESKRRFLADESKTWVERGIINSTQRDGIMSCYVTTKKLPAIILTLGAAMIGTGVLSIIAANWRHMSPLLKIIIIVSAYAGCVAAAYFCEKKGRLTASDILMFLSGFLLLGGLALLSQIFHIEGTIDGLLLTWLVVYAPTFLLVRNILIFVIYEIVAVSYICTALLTYSSNMPYFHEYEPRSLTLGPWLPFAVMLAVVAAAWWEWYRGRETAPAEPRSKLRDFFVGGTTRRIMLSNFLLIIWFSWFCVINSRQASLLPCVMGVLAIGVAIQVIARLLRASDLDWQAMVIISICGLALTFGFVWENRLFGRWSRDFTAETIGSSVALAAYLIWRIMSRHKGGGWATVFFCLLLARWYFDMFFDFMDKGMFFLLGGVLLVATGIAFSKWNKRRSLPDLGGESNE